MATRGSGDAAAGKGGPVWRRRLPSRMEDVGEAGRLLEAFLEEAGVLPEVVYRVSLSFEEVVTNVIKYSHDEGRLHEIQVESVVLAEEIWLEVSDRGRAFNPLEAPPPNLELPHEERPIGGLGIHLVRSLASRTEYERSGDRNILRVTFSLAPGEA